MKEYKKHTEFNGKLLIIGFGSIAKAVLPLILRHIEISPKQIKVISPELEGNQHFCESGIQFQELAITNENYQQVLSNNLSVGDFLLNLSVDVSTTCLITFCQEREVLYLDTCVEPWAGGYVNENLTPSQRSNYALRESVLKLDKGHVKSSTAIITHGANPGLVSHFVKKALINLANDCGSNIDVPMDSISWANLAKDLGVKTIHIAERDTQRSMLPKESDEFVNTWSVDGFIGEGCQPAELGWGTHEKELPLGAQRHGYGRDSAIFLNRPGASVRVRTWTPESGPCLGFLITHGESISISDFLTVKSDKSVIYRPTVHYAYHPCDDAVMSLHELQGKNWKRQSSQRILNEEIISGGIDWLGVLLVGHKRNAYWFGSVLSIDEARELAPFNNATSMQVAAGVLGGIVWAMENPYCGIVEPEAMNHERVLEVAGPYLGNMVGEYTNWTPTSDLSSLFPKKMDMEDPWQFSNILVN